MAKGTLLFLFLLSIFASLLFGINIGKKLEISQRTNNKEQTTNAVISTPTTIAIPTIIPTLIATPSSSLKKSTSVTTYADGTCGFSFSYPGSFMKQRSTNGQSTVLTDPENPASVIASTCASSIPRPPVSSEKIESIMLDKLPATLYHDQNQDGTPRDEVIVKHPVNNQEIIVAGFGEFYRQALSSFKFIQ